MDRSLQGTLSSFALIFKVNDNGGNEDVFCGISAKGSLYVLRNAERLFAAPNEDSSATPVVIETPSDEPPKKKLKE
jgi:hypothetical protein